MFKSLVIALHGITGRFAVGEKRENIATLDGRWKKSIASLHRYKIVRVVTCLINFPRYSLFFIDFFVFLFLLFLRDAYRDYFIPGTSCAMFFFVEEF